MSMLKKLTDLAKSEKGKEFADKATAKAKQMANDPETREKIDAAKQKFNDRVGGDKTATDANKTAGGAPTSGPAPTSTAGAPGETGTTGGSAPTATPGGSTDTGAHDGAGAGDGGKAA
jgi:hypothetical protein